MIHVVTGHICAGKTWYVREHAAGDDVVIDLDRIALAISCEGTQHHEYPQHIMDVARAARWYAIDKAVALHKHGSFSLWIIHAYPTDNDMAIYRRIGASIRCIEAHADTLLERAKHERPARAIAELQYRLTTTQHT